MRIISRSSQDTLKLGGKISKSLSKGDIVCLFGQLGTGKTVLAKGIAQGLGISIAEVISPSFTIARQYEGKLSLSHLDLYRLDRASILELGYEDYLYGDSVVLIEWADRLDGYLPNEYLKIKLKVINDKKRQIDITAVGQRYKKFDY
ncbi:MAG: tRNA (adenosine(37)-N6)-threonylcarbamoyltransferase complex ATPase subunit type 1 TsaE [Candidatus Omnitrophica bacterium]|nr:tRNA (adenosine(37)-N6)-threonylcarbamoyltransferase complex ATPase subunit type 1 TsaE [Candidatus Omnitrophota bacterium]MDD5654046.1 tRNA (adenosine(37)-N6)-threonylcarbamoyltransferase complex ATPase subunit type 1 TsaE [Candidatus Omnitrophota bacterium]